MELRDDDFYDESELGWGMLTLKHAHDSFVSEKTSERYLSFHRQLFSTVAEYHANPNSDMARDLPIFFLNLWAEVQKEPFYLHDYCDEIDLIIELLVKSGNIHTIIDTEQKRKSLACACLTRTVITQNGVSANNNICELLKLWLGKDVLESTLYDTEKIASVLYSPAVLALYDGDINDTDSLPRMLFLDGFPVALSTSTAIANLPRDMA